ncbi:hypothetical protein [Streptomyces olivochromogenes]|uniref:hypothetical protein n=1 Tax=Streptomyces olivochromogenes TaxID=1963 RepID=UPI001F1A98D8|nr:hypothetical protein [Streptomyces olivochromogenes]MCF3131076.1 hypothetical protein [Streptomyces olivochromogenes]
MQDEPQGFPSLTRQWAARHVPTLTMDPAAKLDEDLAGGSPLPGPCGRHVP